MKYSLQMLLLTLTISLVSALFLPAFASAELVVHPTQAFQLPYAQMWAGIIGLLSPLVSYVLNTKLWAEAPEVVKALVHTFVAAVVAAVYTAIATPVFGFNDATLQLIITTVVANFGAHAFIWKPTHVNLRLGARPPLSDTHPIPEGPA